MLLEKYTIVIKKAYSLRSVPWDWVPANGHRTKIDKMKLDASLEREQSTCIFISVRRGSMHHQQNAFLHYLVTNQDNFVFNLESYHDSRIKDMKQR